MGMKCSVVHVVLKDNTEKLFKDCDFSLIGEREKCSFGTVTLHIKQIDIYHGDNIVGTFNFENIAGLYTVLEDYDSLYEIKGSNLDLVYHDVSGWSSTKQCCYVDRGYGNNELKVISTLSSEELENKLRKIYGKSIVVIDKS